MAGTHLSTAVITGESLGTIKKGLSEPYATWFDHP